MGSARQPRAPIESPPSPTVTRRQLTVACAGLVLVMFAGTAGFALIEGWDPWRALFFTLITVFTVGYGDEGISSTGQIFAAVMLLGGIGWATYSLELLIRSAVASQFAWRHRMQAHIDKLSGHTIVCGFGRMGRTICEQLAKDRAELVVVESDEDAFQSACALGHLAVAGCAAEDDVLVRAGLERAATIVCAVDSPIENIVTALTARELSPEISIIARAESEEDVRKLRRAGANRIISPFRSGGLEVANAILRPKVADFLARSAQAESDLALAEIPIESGSALAGIALREYGRGDGKRLAFVALERAGGEVEIPPRGDEILQPDDLLIVAGNPLEIVRMRDAARA